MGWVGGHREIERERESEIEREREREKEREIQRETERERDRERERERDRDRDREREKEREREEQKAPKPLVFGRRFLDFKLRDQISTWVLLLIAKLRANSLHRILVQWMRLNEKLLWY